MMTVLRLTLTAACLFISGLASAQQEFVPQDMSACMQDIGASCTGVQRGGGRIIKCLQDVPTLAADCKAIVMPSDGPAGTVSITVAIGGVKSKSGFVFVTLSDDPAKFPAGRRMAIAPANGGTVTVTFKHLKPNTYVVTAFHDENDNSKFDMGLTGAEGFAASNGVVGPPSFNASAVKISRDTKLTLAMRYF